MRQEGNLSPEAIARRQFAPVGRRGFDKAEVSAFLVEVANAYGAVLQRLERAEAEPSFEQLGSEAGALLQLAKDGADSLRRKAEEEAQSMLSSARDESEELRKQSEGNATAIVERATQEAERRVREAELVARRFRNVTKRQCDQMIAEAQSRSARLEAHQRNMRAKIADMEGVFQAFRAEMESSIRPSDDADIDDDLKAESDEELQDPEELGDEELGDEELDEDAVLAEVLDGDEEEEGDPRSTGVQPKPIFEGESATR
ncbi:MAG: DivIVA domain-containing protein [Actinomycetota bacterium]